MNKQAAKYKDFVLTALLTAIVILLSATPLGFIQLGLIKATVIHVPVIIGSVLLGPKRGAFLGFVFGFASLISNFLVPSVLSFAFCPFLPVPGTAKGSPWALLVCFVPRILVGVVPCFVCQLVQRFTQQSKNGKTIPLLAAGFLGGLTNTLLVMGLIYFLFHNAYAAAKGIPASAVANVVLGVVAVNGIPEALAAAVLTAAVCQPLLKLREKGV